MKSTKLRLSVMLSTILVLSLNCQSQAKTGVGHGLTQLAAINIDDESYKDLNQKIELKTVKNIISSDLKPMPITKNQNMSKKFGPLKLKFKLRSLRRARLKFNIDLIEALDLIATRPSFIELSQAFSADDKHFILSPELKDEVGSFFTSLTTR